MCVKKIAKPEANLEGKYKKCPTCKGKTYIKCPRCKGKGCPSCSRHGQVKCSRCNGAGYVYE